MKIVVFLYEYYLKKYNSHTTAYIYVGLWFFVIFGIFFTTTLLKIFNMEFLQLHKKGRIYGYIEGLIISIPFFILFYILCPPKKIRKYLNKYEYSDNYIWYLRLGFVVYILFLMYIVENYIH